MFISGFMILDSSAIRRGLTAINKYLHTQYEKYKICNTFLISLTFARAVM